MLNLNRTYRFFSALTAVFFLASSVVPAVFACAVFMSGPCGASDVPISPALELPSITEAQTESDCCQPKLPDCHENEENGPDNPCCNDCQCGISSTKSPAKSSTFSQSQQNGISLTGHHISHIYFHSGLTVLHQVQIPDFTAPPIYLLNSAFLN